MAIERIYKGLKTATVLTLRERLILKLVAKGCTNKPFFLAECPLLFAGDVSNGLVWLGCGTRRTTKQRDIGKLTDAC